MKYVITRPRKKGFVYELSNVVLPSIVVLGFYDFVRETITREKLQWVDG